MKRKVETMTMANKVKIKLLVGACGYESVRPDGSIQRSFKTPEDGPFLCPATMAIKMIRSGQAKALESVPSSLSISKACAPVTSSLEKFTLKELKALADKEGLIYNALTTENELIEALEELDSA